MRLRAAHLACLVFLLSSLGVAEASALRSGALADICIAGLLHQAASQHQEERLAAATPHSLTAETLPPANSAITQQTWTMRAPTAQATRIHTLTGLRR